MAFACCSVGVHPWLTLFSSFLISFFTVGTAMGNAAVYYNYWLEEFNAQKSLTALVGAVNLGLILILGPIASVLANRFTHRVVVCAGGVLSSASMLAAGFMDSIPGLLVTHMVCGLGWCLSNVPGTMAPSFYWDEQYHGAVFGVIISGVGVGTFIVPLMVEALREAFTWRGALIIQAGLNLNLVVCGAIFIPKPGMRKKSNFLEPQLLKDPYFVNSLFYWSFVHMGISVGAVHIAYVIKMALGVDDQQAAIFVAIFGISGTFARIAHGIIGRLPGVNTLLQQMIAVTLMASCLFTIPSIQNYGLMIVIVILAAMGIGSMSLNAILMMDIVGPKSRTAGFGFFATAAGLGFSCGAPIAGLLSDVTQGNYAVSLYFGGGIQILAVLVELWVLVRWKYVRGRHVTRIAVPTVEEEEDVEKDEDEDEGKHERLELVEAADDEDLT